MLTEDSPASPHEVAALAKEFKLDKSPRINPQLAFDAEDFTYWHALKLSEPELRLRFAAARAILDAADEQEIFIRDRKTLAGAAVNLVLIARRGGDKTQAGITSADRSGNLIDVLCEGESSEDLIRQAWESLNPDKAGLGKQNLEKALACTKGVVDELTEQADNQQAERLNSGGCKKPPRANEKETYFAEYWALSDVAAAWYIRGQVFALQKKWTAAGEAYRVVSEKYSCAYTYDPRKNLFWRTADGAVKEIRKLP